MKMLCYIVVLLTVLLKVINIKAECQRPYVGENRVLTPESDQPSYPSGSVAKFKCAVGYKTAKSIKNSIQCNGDQWTELELQCKKKSCGSVADISNGRYIFDSGIDFGATIRAECDSGYQLIGPKTRQCLDAGWSDRAPVCEVVRCQTPPEIENGQLVDTPYESYEYGQAVTYTCKRRFTLIGNDVISCSENGTFQPEPPKCLYISCGKPNIMNAIRIEGKLPPYEYKYSVRYKCIEGYRIEGPDHLVCDINGWTPSLPNCTEVTCANHPIKNGQLGTKEDIYKYKQEVTYSCEKGFRTDGPSKISCSGDGTFQPSPQCLEVTCPKLPSINNGQLQPQQDKYRYEQEVTYSCNKGFTIKGASKISCSDDGTFQPLPPECLEVTCPNVPSENNGQLDPQQNIYKYGQIFTYLCKKGFTVNRMSHFQVQVLCTDDGTFRPPPPVCTENTCPQLPSIENGQLNPQQDIYRYGQEVTYVCDTGFEIHGASKILCSENGTFHPPPPLCSKNHLIKILIGLSSGILLVLMLAVLVLMHIRQRKKAVSGSYALAVLPPTIEKEEPTHKKT